MILVDDAGTSHDVGAPVRREGQVHVAVDGQAFALAVEPVAPGTYRVQNGDRAEVIHCVADGTTIQIAWRGRTYRLRRQTAAARAGVSGRGSLEAPMPGRVVQVAVAAGDAVVKGQGLVVIEAMKMENVVRAPRDGRVASVAVEVGARVTPGQRLIELE